MSPTSDKTTTDYRASFKAMQGNVSQESRDAIADFFATAIAEGDFASSIARRLKATEAVIHDRTEEPGKKELRLTLEMNVEQDMLNGMDTLHGGCSTFLIDVCSTLALTLLGSQVTQNSSHVSLVLNTVFHAPAPRGCRLQIVSTTVVLGNRVLTARTEIFDKTHNRLVVSGVLVKMVPPGPRL